jgi:hypothetical protein
MIGHSMQNFFEDVLAALDAADSGGDLRLQQAKDVARGYGALLAASPADPEEAPDDEDLPFAKDAIKHALLMMLGRVTDPALRERLRIGYVRLADWQPGLVPPAMGIDIANARTAGNPLAFASRLMAAQAPVAQKRRAAARAERATLAEELRRRGIQ